MAKHIEDLSQFLQSFGVAPLALLLLPVLITALARNVILALATSLLSFASLMLFAAPASATNGLAIVSGLGSFLVALESVGLHRIERLLRLQALKARPRRRRLPPDLGERQATAVAANVLERSFGASAPNRKWIADFTYVWTAEGWLYVAAVIDLFSPRVVGWSMSAAMTAQLVTDALVMAIWRRVNPMRCCIIPTAATSTPASSSRS